MAFEHPFIPKNFKWPVNTRLTRLPEMRPLGWTTYVVFGMAWAGADMLTRACQVHSNKRMRIYEDIGMETPTTSVRITESICSLFK